MAHLVADHPADGAVVDGHIGLGIEERRLQDRGREHDLVHGRVVVGVHRLGRHAPLGAVDRAAQPPGAALPLELFGPLGVAVEVVRRDLQGGVVAPSVGIGDLDGEVGELVQRLLLGHRGHPVELLDARGEGALQVVDQLQHLGLGLGREVALDVELAHRLAHGRIGRRHRPFPAHRLLGLAAQGLVAELEARVAERLGQVGRGRVGHGEGQPRLEHRQRGLGEDGGLLREGGVVRQDRPVGLAQAAGFQEAVEVEARRIGRELGQGHGVVGLVPVAPISPLPARLGQAGLEGDDVGGAGLGVGPAGQGQHAGDIGLVGGLLRREGRLEVVVLVRQAHAVGAHVEHVVGRVLGVGRDVGPEDGPPEQVMAAHHRGDVLAGGGRTHDLQVRLQRLGAQGVDASVVHVGAVEGADLAARAVERRAGRGRVLEDGVDPVFRQHGQGVEGAEAGAVGRDDHVVDIGPVGVAEEVVARLDGLVLAAGVEAPAAIVRRGQPRIARRSPRPGGQRRAARNGARQGCKSRGREQGSPEPTTGRKNGIGHGRFSLQFYFELPQA